MRFIKLMAIALPVALFVSCTKDGPKDGDNSRFVRDGENYIIESWLRYDADGNKAGSVYGLVMDQSNPTVRAILVENLQQAKEHFRNILAPLDAKVIVDGDNMTVQLTDTEGNVKNNLFFKAVNDEKIFARVTLEKEVGVEQFVTEFLYMSESECAEYQIIEGDCPFEEGGIYSHKTDYNHGRPYLCICLPSSEGPGLLIGDAHTYQKIYSNTQRESEKACANMPRIEIFNRIWTILNNTDSASSTWQKLCATSGSYIRVDPFNPYNDIWEYKWETISVPEFKKRIYWVNEMPNDNEDITIFNLVEGCLGSIEPRNPYVSWSQDTAEWVMDAYMFYYNNDKGELVVEKCTSQHLWSSEWKDKWPAPDTFIRDPEAEKFSETIALQ